MSWDDVGYLKASEIRRQILEALEKPMTPTELSRALPNHPLPAAISRALRELEKNTLVICLNPKQRKGRLYQTTRQGTAALEVLKGTKSS